MVPSKFLDKHSLNRRYCLSALSHGLKFYSQVFPNPPVGAILVKNAKVIARGAHEQAGLPHAEVNAIKNAGDEAKGADLYVSLEPCNHFGRTPPCTKSILESGIKRVYYLIKDNTKAGGGGDFLREQGVEVHWVEPNIQIIEYLEPWRLYGADGVVSLTPVMFLDLGGSLMDPSLIVRNRILKRTQKIIDTASKSTELDAYDVSFLVHSGSNVERFIEMQKDAKVRVSKVVIVRATKYLPNNFEPLPNLVLESLGVMELNKVQLFQGFCIEEYRRSHV